jgi:hypothetical protein
MNQRLRVLQDLGVQIERLAAEAAPSSVGTSGRRRRLLPLVIALALLAFAAAALAATGVFKTGAPVRTGVGDLTHPGSDFGGVRPGHVSGILAQSPDPAGGPPWGIRVIGTTRGVACLQVGRVVNGRLSVLGQDGLFHDDGLFHPLPTAVTTPSDGCFAPDAAGNLFTAVEDANVPASGLSLRFSAPPAETIAPPGGCSNGDLHTPQKLPPCPVGDERALYYGMLGPQATGIAYTASGERRTVATGKGGAYLIVLTASKLLDGGGSSLIPLPGAQPIRQITYHNGAACDIPVEAAGKACPLVGYQPARLPRPDHVAATLHVTHPIGPPPGAAGGPRLHGLAVEFTARVAITSAQTGYVLVLQRCGGGSFGVGTRTNIAAGERVTLRLAAQIVGPCPGGNYTGAVYYVDELGNGLPPGLILPGRARPAASLGLGGDVLVGRFSFATQ